MMEKPAGELRKMTVEKLKPGNKKKKRWEAMGEFWEKITGSIGTGNGAGSSGPPKWFRRDNLLILILLGVLLFIIAMPVKKEDPQAASSVQENGDPETAVETGIQAVTAGSTEEYTAYLEGKLKEMLESVRGLGEVEVMITLESSEERIVEKDMTADRSQTEEQDSAGGTRTVSSSNTGYQTIYQDGSQGSPFVVKTITPRVEGVLVVAEGAGKGNMTSEITQIAQALFGVEAHKVKVLEK